MCLLYNRILSLALFLLLVLSPNILAKPNPAISSKSHQPWLTPIQGYYVSRSFGEKNCHQQPNHRGVDMVTATATAVVAPAPGLVMATGQVDPFFGGLRNLIAIDHGHGLISVYANLSEHLVESGQWVKAGQRIAMTEALSKEIKYSTTHVEFIQDGNPIDPFKLIPYVFFDLQLAPSQ